MISTVQQAMDGTGDFANDPVTNVDTSTRFNALKANYTTLMNELLAIYSAIADEADTLDELMDANGNNPDEHHAKTMVLYGRKVANRELFLGIASSDPNPLNIPLFTGLDDLMHLYSTYVTKITWDASQYKIGKNATNPMSDIYRDGAAPDVQQLSDVPMTYGSPVQMPTIVSFKPGNTNKYMIKSGYKILGWTPLGNVNLKLLNDAGTDYKREIVSGYVDPQPIDDTREFAFGSTTFKVPAIPVANFTPRYPTAITFVLSVVAIWYNIEFVVTKSHATAAAEAPCNIPINTRIGEEVTLPLTSLITVDSGWKISTEAPNPPGGTFPQGCWTNKNPETGKTDPDPDGQTMDEFYFGAGSKYVIGSQGQNQIHPGIRKLYLLTEAS